MDYRDQITIGVELEFLICDLREDLVDVEEEFILVTRSLEPLAEDLGARVFTSGTDIFSMGHDDKELSLGFNVQEDSTIVPGCRSERGVEVATPILRNGEWETVIPAMCKALKTMFKMGFNATTGLHVHVGIGEEYTLSQLKSISKAVILFEDQMDCYHGECRSGSLAMGAEDRECYIRSCRHNRILGTLTNQECLAVIDDANTHNELFAKINCTPRGRRGGESRYYKYNITSFRKHGTVEFRQAMATDNEVEILDWIRRVILFVNCAISTTKEVFHELAKPGINDPIPRELATTGMNDPKIYEQFGVPVPARLMPQPLI